MKRWTKLAAGTALFGLLENIRELNCFRVERYRIPVPGMPEKKLVFLSDLHGKEYGGKNRRLIAAVERERPDMILAGGDMLVRNNASSAAKAFALLARLAGIAPVYCANGNHEQKMKRFPKTYGNRYQKYKSALKKYGVNFLENETEEFDWDGVPVALSGLELPTACYGCFESRVSLKQIERLVGKADPERYHILLAHNPAYMERYWEWGADLVLSGHLHGGIVRLPAVGGVISPQRRIFPKYSGGMYGQKDRFGIVSRGLGTHTVNIRLFNEAELTVVSLGGSDEGERRISAN